MPNNIKPHGQIHQHGHNNADISRIAPETAPRDDIRTAFSGDENRGPARQQKATVKGDRHLKSRRLHADQKKIPVR